MTPYYADAAKHLFHSGESPLRYRTDQESGQSVAIYSTVFGIMIRPQARWTRFCEKLFRKFAATGVWLDDISIAPDGALRFIGDLPGCRRLSIEGEGKVDLTPLAGNPLLEELQIGPAVKPGEFDLASLPNLRRCRVPLRRELASFLHCAELLCLSLQGGRHEGCLSLDSLASLEEFICVNVSKLAGVVFHPRVRLRSLELSHLKVFESAEPAVALTGELLLAKLDHVPRMKYEWLGQAHKAECIALRLGEIPTIKCLQGLKHLQVLDLFGSKVKDGDLSFRDSLNGELSPRLWGGR